MTLQPFIHKIAAYGWTDYTPEMSEDVVIHKRLPALDLKRAANFSAKLHAEDVGLEVPA